MKKHCKRTALVILLTLVAALILFPIASTALAANTSEAKAIYGKYDMPQNNILSYIFRQLGWLLVSGLYWLVSAVEKAVWDVTGLFSDFWQNGDAQSIVGRVRFLAAALLILVICYIAWQAFNDKVKWAEIGQNLLLGILVILCLPTLMTYTMSLTRSAMTYIKGSSSASSITSSLVTSNIIDVCGYDTPGTFAANGDVHPSGKVFGGDGISINDLIEPKNMSNEWEDIYSHYLDNGVVKEVNKAEPWGIKIEILSTQYYRYKVNWFAIFANLLISAVAYIFTGIKLARLLYELVINQALAEACAFLDIQNGQRLKKCLQTILSTFLTLCGVYLCFSFYVVGQAYLAAKVTELLPRLIIMLAMAWALIDGPNLFEKIVGVDAGLNDGVRTMYGVRAAAGMARSVGRGIVGTRMMDGTRQGGLVGAAKAIGGGTVAAAGATAEVGGRAAGNVAARVEARRTRSETGTQPPSPSEPSSPRSQRSTSSQTEAVPVMPNRNDAATKSAATQPIEKEKTSNASSEPVPSATKQSKTDVSMAAPPSSPDRISDIPQHVPDSSPVLPPETTAPVPDMPPKSTETSDKEIDAEKMVVVERAAAESVDNARRQTEERGRVGDTLHTQPISETKVPMSMSEYVREKAKKAAPVAAARQIADRAAKGYKDGKTLQQYKAQRRDAAMNVPLPNQHSAVEQRREEIRQRQQPPVVQTPPTDRQEVANKLQEQRKNRRSRKGGNKK